MRLFYKPHQAVPLIILIAAALIIGPFLIISIYSHPTADDFCYSIFADSMGFWAAQVEHYMIWTGRYTATALLTAQPVDLDHLGIFRLIPAALLVLFATALFLFVKALLPRISRKDQLILSLLFFFLYMYSIPAMAEAFYFMAASVTYQLASILSLFLFAVILELTRQRNSLGRGVHILLACLLSIATIGLNETSMVALVVILSLWTGAGFYFDMKNKKALLIIFFVSVVAALVVVLAPGNAVRMAEKPEKFQLFFSILGASKLTLLFILRWFPPTILVIVLFIDLFRRIAAEVDKRLPYRSTALWHLVLFALFILSFLILLFFPSFWSQGGGPPFRTVNAIYLIYVLGAFSLTVLFLIHVKQHKKFFPEVSRKLKLFLSLILFSMILFKPNNIQEVYKDLISERAAQYHKELQNRYKLLKECRAKTCYVPVLVNLPRTIFSYDLTNDPTKEIYYYNQCLSEFFTIPFIMTISNKEELVEQEAHGKEE